MDTKHIKSVRLVTDESEMWSLFDFALYETWNVVFEVSEEFRDRFNEHMRSEDVDCMIDETALAEGEFGMSRKEWEQLGTFTTNDGARWFITQHGGYIVRADDYEDLFDKQVPDDWWMSCIALMKEVLRKTV